MSDRKTNKVDATKVKDGELMAFTYYVKVKEVSQNGAKLVVGDVDHDGSPITITGKELVENALSADYFAEEEKVTMTKAAELLVGSAHKPFTVAFEKADGTERVLRGRLIKPEALLGRSMVEDLDTYDKNRLRQVDHRTIRFLIVDGIKYLVR